MDDYSGRMNGTDFVSLPATEEPLSGEEGEREAGVDGEGSGVHQKERGSSVDNSNNSSSSLASSTSPPGSSAPVSNNSSSRRSSSSSSRSNGHGNQASVEMLQAENALLRLALEEAEEKLRLATTTTNISGRSVRPVRSSSLGRTVRRSKEPGNGGVAYAQMRRLLLKDERFLRDTFLPFLNMDDFGRLSSVCRRLKRSTYDLDSVVRCVESGGVTDSNRGLMWLIMVGMDTVEPASRGVLGVVIRERGESPEEQYDRLHRAMNGTIAEPTPAAPSVTPETPATAATNGDGTASTDGGPADRKPDPEHASSHGAPGLVIYDESSSDGEHMNNRSNCVRGDSECSTGSGVAGGGGGGASDGGVGGGGSVVTDVSVAGDASVGGESVLLWEDSGHGGKGGAPNTSPRVQLEAAAAAAAAAAAVPAGPTTTEATVEDQEATEAAEMAAMAKAAEEAAHAAFDAEAAAGIRPLGGRPGAAAVAAAAAAAAAAARAEGEGEAGVPGEEGGVAGSPSQQHVPPAATEAAPSKVVGWASGLFRRSPGTSSPGGSGGGLLSPGIASSRAASDQSEDHGPQSSAGSAEAKRPGVLRMASTGKGLFGGLRHYRTNSGITASNNNNTNNPKSMLPADVPSPTVAASESFFGKNSRKEEDACPPAAAAAGAGAGTVRDETDSKGDAKIEGEPRFERVPGLYDALLMSADAMDENDIMGVRGPKQGCFVDIEKDLQRTLGMTDVTPLRNVLRCTSTFVPDVGYVQVYQDEEEAFWVFVGMLQRFRLRELYCPGMPLLRLRFFQLNRLLMWHLPELYEHFEACGVQTNLFATSWFMTLLSDGGMLPDTEVKTVWDRIFLHSSSPASQWAPIFLFLLELLRRAGDALRQESRFSELIQRLVNMPFRELCRGNGACSTIEEARRRFETSSPMPVQLLLLHDQWTEGGGEDGNSPPDHDEKQLS